MKALEVGTEGGREVGREGGMEGGREGGMEGGMEGGREGGREALCQPMNHHKSKTVFNYTMHLYTNMYCI